MIPEIFFWVRSCFRSHKEGKREKKEKDGAGGEEWDQFTTDSVRYRSEGPLKNGPSILFHHLLQQLCFVTWHSTGRGNILGWKCATVSSDIFYLAHDCFRILPPTFQHRILARPVVWKCGFVIGPSENHLHMLWQCRTRLVYCRHQLNLGRFLDGCLVGPISKPCCNSFSSDLSARQVM